MTAAGRLIVTGASGYIGRRVLARAGRAGLLVEAWSRQPVSGAVRWQRYELSGPLPQVDGAIRGIIHLAADLSQSLTLENESAALLALADLASLHAAPLLFVSSQTALNPGSPYGRRKQALEQAVAARAVIVRPGLVVGGRDPTAAVRALQKLARLPIVPRIVPPVKLQLVHVDDLAEGLLELACGAARPQVVELGGAPLALEDVVAGFRRQRGAQPALHVPVPRALLDNGLRLAWGAVAEQARSLLALSVMTATRAPERLLADLLSPHANPRRRALVEEARDFVFYTCGAAAIGPVKRYVRAIERHGGMPLDLAPHIRRSSRRLSTLESAAEQVAPGLGWRLDAALTLGEATVHALDRFYLQRPIHPLAALVNVAGPALSIGRALIGRIIARGGRALRGGADV